MTNPRSERRPSSQALKSLADWFDGWLADLTEDRPRRCWCGRPIRSASGFECAEHDDPGRNLGPRDGLRRFFTPSPEAATGFIRSLPWPPPVPPSPEETQMPHQLPFGTPPPALQVRLTVFVDAHTWAECHGLARLPTVEELAGSIGAHVAADPGLPGVESVERSHP